MVSPENLIAKLGNTAMVFCENIFTDEYPKSAAQSHIPFTPPFARLRMSVLVLYLLVDSNLFSSCCCNVCPDIGSGKPPDNDTPYLFAENRPEYPAVR